MGGQQQLVSGLFIQFFGFSWFSCITLSTLRSIFIIVDKMLP